MATFYLLPPRPLLEEALPRLLDLPFAPVVLGPELAEALRAGLTYGEVFAVFREELPDGAGADEALRDGFGAEAGDEVVELRLMPGGLRSMARRVSAA